MSLAKRHPYNKPGNRTLSPKTPGIAIMMKTSRRKSIGPRKKSKSKSTKISTKEDSLSSDNLHTYAVSAKCIGMQKQPCRLVSTTPGFLDEGVLYNQDEKGVTLSTITANESDISVELIDNIVTISDIDSNTACAELTSAILTDNDSDIGTKCIEPIDMCMLQSAIITDNDSDSACVEPIVTLDESDIIPQCETDLEKERELNSPECEIGPDPVPIYDHLKSNISNVVMFPYQLNSNSKLIQIIELYPTNDDVSQPTVKLSLTIDKDLSAKLFVHRIEICRDHDFWMGLPSKFDTPLKISAIVKKLLSFSVCVGSPDECFQNLVGIGRAKQDMSGDTSAYREGDLSAVKGNLHYTSTIRSTLCKLLVQGARCQPCSKVRRNLRDRRLRQEEKSRILKTSPTPNYMQKKFRHRNMNRKALIDKLKQQHSKIKLLQSEVGRLQRQFRQEVRSKGVELDVGHIEAIGAMWHKLL
ncbi:uncharacterized protein LOC110459888 [Mizuhopecten yessoensis]|uniref:Uncharacterized protein n=1 Tax=Mizuhopecten yessoensis TaxID=6573 RepID=A0A210Q3I3_MIZYE|nr:uncharacterized protein LOC110459888 [Mizuhopecten yessoensis]OWF43318.1 hypothetical protein KP79_PYT01895 [Mizuhopecten yessoensis]